MTDPHYDLIVVGGGAAGLAGAKMAARSLRRVLVIDAGTPRNAPADGVHNYLYAEGTPPAELARIGRAEAAAYGVDIVDGHAESARVLPDPPAGGPRFELDVGGRSVAGRRLLLATGSIDELPDIPGLAEGWGHDVLHCPFCHGYEVRGQRIVILGTGPMILHQAGMWGSLSDQVTVVWANDPGPTDDEREQLEANGVDLVVGTISDIDRSADTPTVRTTGDRSVPADAVVVATKLHARTDLLSDLGLELVEMEVMGAVMATHLEVDGSGLTSVPGIWAAGNLTTPMAQVVASASAGAQAGAMAHVDLIAEDTQIAVNERAARR